MLRRNVLIFHSGALGDFVLTWPIAMALCRLHPQSRVFYVTQGQKGKLAEKALGIDSTDVEAGWHHLFGEDATLPASAEKLLFSAHTIVTFVSNGADTWAANVKRLSPETLLIPLATPPRGAIEGRLHVSEFFLKQLEPYQVVATAARQIFRSVADRGIGGRLPADGRALIHPGAGGTAKCWPLDRFIALADRLKADGRKVEFVLGEAEMEKWSKAGIDRLSPLQTPGDLVSLYQLIRGASCYIGNDSGPGHLAGIVGVPTTIVFGPGDPTSWKPLGPAVRTVASPRIDEIDVNAVYGLVSE